MSVFCHPTSFPFPILSISVGGGGERLTRGFRRGGSVFTQLRGPFLGKGRPSMRL